MANSVVFGRLLEGDLFLKRSTVLMRTKEITTVDKNKINAVVIDGPTQGSLTFFNPDDKVGLFFSEKKMIKEFE